MYKFKLFLIPGVPDGCMRGHKHASFRSTFMIDVRSSKPIKMKFLKL